MALLNITSFSDTENQSFTAAGIDATFNAASPGQWDFASRTYTDSETFSIDPTFYGVGNNSNTITLDQNAGVVAGGDVVFTVLTGTTPVTVTGITGNIVTFSGAFPPVVTFSLTWPGIEFNAERVRFVHQGYDNEAVTSVADYNFTDCNWEDGGAVSAAASNALGATGIKNYNFTRTLFVSTTNQDTAFGESGTSYTNRLTVTDCVFAGYGNSKWFINLAGVDASALPGTQLKNTGVNTPSRGISFNGLSFDGSVRAENHNRNGYTVRCVGGGENRSNNYMTNFEIGDLGQYNEGNSATPQGTFSTHSSWATSDNIYLINNQYQYSQTTPAGDTAFTMFSSGGDATFREAYHWRPSFVRPDQSAATDIKFIDMLSTTGADVLVKQMPTNAESSDTNLTDVTSNNDLYLPGYVIEVSNGVSGDATVAVTAAQQYDAATDTHTLKPQFAISPFAKSFTDIVPIEVTSEVTDFTSDPATFAVTSQAHTIASAVDINLNGKTVTTALEAADEAADLYPQLKSTWYSSTATETNEEFGLTIENGILTSTRNITLGSASAYTTANFGFNCGAVISSSPTVTTLVATSIEVDGTGLDGITINGATTGGFGALTNGANITATNAAAETVASIDATSSFDSVGGLTVTNGIAGTAESDGNISTTTISGTATTGAGNITATGNISGSAISTTGNIQGAELSGTSTTQGTAVFTSINGGTSTASTTTVNGNTTNATFVGNVTALDRTFTNPTIGAGTHNLASTDIDGGTLSGTVTLGDGVLSNNVTLTSNPTLTITSTNITAWSSTGNAVIEATAALSVQITADQVDQFTAGPSGNVTFVAPVDYDVVTITIPAATNGRYSIRKNDAELIAPSDIVSGTPITLTFTTETGTDTATTFYGMLEADILRIARKYDSDLADDGNRYIEERHNETFGTGDRAITLSDSTPIGFLAEAAIASTGITPTISDAGLIQITSDAGTPISIIAPPAMGLALEIGNLDGYFQVFHNANSDVATQQIQGGSAVGWDASRLTMQSGNVVEEDLPPAAGGANVTVNVPLQHAIAGWSPITGEPSALIASRGGVLEIDGSVSGQASLGQVTQAVDASSVASTADINEIKANQSNLKGSIESNPYVAPSNLPFNTAD